MDRSWKFSSRIIPKKLIRMLLGSELVWHEKLGRKILGARPKVSTRSDKSKCRNLELVSFMQQ